MATTLVERVRQVVAVEDDEFFKAETILYYINKAQRKVTSYMIQKEKTSPTTSLRALDNIRQQVKLFLTNMSQKDNYFETYLPFPSNLLDFGFLRYKNRTILRELTSAKVYLLEWGNLSPTEFESYFYITKDGSVKSFQTFLPDVGVNKSTTITLVNAIDPGTVTAITVVANSGTVNFTDKELIAFKNTITNKFEFFVVNGNQSVGDSIPTSLSVVSKTVTNTIPNSAFELYRLTVPDNNINLFYFKAPTDLTLTATTLVDLPEQLENAVVYGAAVMMITQESVRDPEGNINVISQTYQEELQANAY